MIKPNKISISKILDFPEPKAKKEVQCYLGLVNTLRHWSDKLNVSLPNIRALAGKNSKWTWNETHKKVFKTVKNLAR